MTREQRWIRAQQRRLEDTIDLAKKIRLAVDPNTLRRYRRELATIKSVSMILALHANGELVPRRFARRPSAGGRQP